MGDIKKTQRAIRFAVKTHEIYRKQMRKSENISYISHPLTVGIILSQVGASDNLICAGILHDTIEDSIPAKKVSFGMLEERFGLEVAQMVLDVTEENKALPWAERKRKAVERVKSLSRDSLLLKAADLISNLSELVDSYKKEGDRVFEVFNAPEPKKESFIQNSLNTVYAIIARWPENPLALELRELANALENIKDHSQ